MTYREQLLSLAASLAKHDSVTHWAISMSFRGKGDFFERLQRLTPKRRKPVSCSADNYERALKWFSANWPADHPWPVDIPRPAAKSKEAA